MTFSLAIFTWIFHLFLFTRSFSFMDIHFFHAKFSYNFCYSRFHLYFWLEFSIRNFSYIWFFFLLNFSLELKLLGCTWNLSVNCFFEMLIILLILTAFSISKNFNHIFEGQSLRPVVKMIKICPCNNFCIPCFMAILKKRVKYIIFSDKFEGWYMDHIIWWL